MARAGEVMNYRLLAILISICICTSTTVFAQSVQFKKTHIASESYESVGVADLNGNGQLDIISGEYWYEGPDFSDRHFVGQIERRSEYWDDFAAIMMDVNGNGRMDIISGGWFSESLHWRENPGDNSEWQKHIIDQTGNVETARAWDVDGDGFLEIVPNNPNDPLKYYKLERDPNGNATGTFQKVPVADGQGHGLGFGDVNGNGRGDFIVSNGWLESPDDITNSAWTLHEEFDLGSASIPILVVDVNGSGMNDLIVGQAHDYGLDWYEQTTDESGNRQWTKHSIDPFGSQFHTMEWVDIDGDGNYELVTGKRYRAHNGNDPGANDPIGLYYYKWNGTSFVRHTIASGPLGVGKGTGIYFSVADLNDSGYKDIIVAGKDGLYLFYNKGFE
ncbi:MAG: VCBS repeat-containing protein [Balneolaceae bacterium]|nr:VCBS repeat-containing protein [Balneolaceae bacterium]